MTFTVTWLYTRSGCKSCGQLLAFLEKHHIKVATRVDARKSPLDRLAAFRIAQQANEVYAARRRFVLYLNLCARKPEREVLERMLLGRTGRLRAPVFLMRGTLIVGFHEATLNLVFGFTAGDPRKAVGD